MEQSDAYRDFLKSMRIGYDEWHDGVGYDMEAFAKMSPAERDEAAAEARGKSDLDWRDMEVLGAHGGRESIERLRHLLVDGSPTTAGWALRVLIDGGYTPGSVADVQLAHLLERIDSVDQLTPALELAEINAGPMTRLQLLRGIQSRPAIAVNFADTLLKLAGVGGDMPAFDPQLRPILLRLLERGPARESALEEIYRLTGIDAATIPPLGAPNERAWAEAKWSRL